MTKINWLSRLPNEHPVRTKTRRVAGGIGVAVLLLITGIAVAQTPATADASNAPLAPTPTVQNGYVIHETADLGGRVAGIYGSGAMYDTMVNLHSGPRVLGETFTMHAVPGSKHPLADNLTAFSSGFGGDPNDMTKMDFSKGKVYEFSGMFRRDRQYFDYDLMGNPNIIPGQGTNIGALSNLPGTPCTTVNCFGKATINQSPELFNTVRRMTDTSLTLFPISKVTFRFAYSQDIFQGPSLSPQRSIGKTQILVLQHERNSSDDFLGAVDWKPLKQTKLTLEAQVTHVKEDTWYSLAPSKYSGNQWVQEANGQQVALGDWDNLSQYPVADCNTTSMATHTATNGVIFTSASGTAGLPVVDPACSVNASYTRYQPTRSLFPTGVFRIQSASLKNIQTNGDFHYTGANSNLPNDNEQFAGLDGAVRTVSYTGPSNATRRAVAADYGIIWQAFKNFSIGDQVDYSNVSQPGFADQTAGITTSTPTTAGSETINYAGVLLTPPASAPLSFSGGPNGVLQNAYFGEKIINNNVTSVWDIIPRATVSLTYHYRSTYIAETHVIFPVIPTSFNFYENGGVFNVALRPTDHWSINGTAEATYDNGVLTPIDPRETQHYRVHSLYKPTTWATISAAVNDLERHNNTNNSGNYNAAGAYLGPGNLPTAAGSADGPLQHYDYSRAGSVGVNLAPNEHYGLDMNYAYTDVYATTNICYLPTNAITNPGYPDVVGQAGQTKPCPDLTTDWLAKDFMKAPTQFASFGLAVSPVNSIHAVVGYSISSVSGSRFFNRANDVLGSLDSAYQSPYVNLAWTVHPGWVWKADYNYYGYGEGDTGQATGQLSCSTQTPLLTTAATTARCSTLLPSGAYNFTAPRNFHASLLTLSMHYEF